MLRLHGLVNLRWGLRSLGLGDLSLEGWEREQLLSWQLCAEGLGAGGLGPATVASRLSLL